MTTWVPLANLLFGVIGLTWLFVRTRTRRSEYPKEITVTLRAMMGLYFVLLCVSLEMLLRTDIPTYSAAPVLCAKVGALIVLWQTRHTKYRTGTRTDDGDEGDDPDKEVPTDF